MSAHSAVLVFFRVEVFNFNEAQVISYSFHGSCLSMLYVKAHHHTEIMEFLLCSLPGIL